MENKKLFRSVDDSVIGGVCGGLAEHFQIDSSLVRIIFILLTLFGGSGILIYLVLWLMLPSVNQNKKKIIGEEKIKALKGKRVNVFGVVLILVGLTALWNQIFPEMIDWDLFWPIILVLMGVLLIFRD